MISGFINVGGDIIEVIFHTQITGRCGRLLIEEGGREERMKATKIILSKAGRDTCSNNCFFRVLRLVSIQCSLRLREG